MRLIFCDTIDGNSSSLKNVDPLDFIGDGSNIPLEVGDRAVVANAADKTAFYVIKEAIGQSDNGILILIPNINPGGFYWSCCGFTNDKLTAPSGTNFTISDGSEIAPEGFTASKVPYSDLPFASWDVWHNEVEVSYEASAIVDNILYIVNGGWLNIWDLTTEVYTLDTTTNTHNMGNVSSHCLENPEGGSDNIISDFVNLTDISRFLITEREPSHLPISFVSPATSWTDIWGIEQRPGMGVRHGKWHYGAANSSSITGFCRADITTGKVYKLADFPVAPDNGCIIPDFETGQIYYVNSSIDGATMRYTPDTDSWETLSPFAGEIGWLHMCWIDQEALQLIIPGFDNNTHIYDIVTNTWTSYPYHEIVYGGFPLYYREIGMIAPFGYENPDYSLTHCIIRKDNPTRITKT